MQASLFAAPWENKARCSQLKHSLSELVIPCLKLNKKVWMLLISRVPGQHLQECWFSPHYCFLNTVSIITEIAM